VLLSQEQKRHFVDEGYVVVPDVMDPTHVDAALRAINAALGNGGADRITNYVFEGHEACDPLQHDAVLLGLLDETSALSLAEQLTEPGALVTPSCCQLATKFPHLGDRYPAIPHLDGIPNGTNGLPPHTLYPFTLLVGVFLSDAPTPDCGNLVVWPGSHRVVEQYAHDHPEGWFDERGYGPPPIGIPDFGLGDGVEVGVHRGDVVLAHYQLVHTGGCNLSPHIRYAVYFRLEHRDQVYDWSSYRDLWRGYKGAIS